MGAAEMKAGHTEEYVDGTSAAPWPQLDGVRPTTSPASVDDRRSEDGEGRGGAKYGIPTSNYALGRVFSQCALTLCLQMARINDNMLLSQLIFLYATVIEVSECAEIMRLRKKDSV